MKYNETKRKILNILSKGTYSSKEIHQILKNENEDISLQAVRMGIQRYKKWDLVTVHSRIKGTKETRCELSDKGKSRLRWLMNQQKLAEKKPPNKVTIEES